MGDVGDLNIERGGVEQVEPPPRQHPLPGPVGDAGRFSRRHLIPKRDEVIPLCHCLRMIFPENRFPLFRIML
jgi:hypothetical protein